jgi:endonuclease/exonuclease/phosphatase family metal-dependent hydrolase
VQTETSNSKSHTLAFYNLENLFDYREDAAVCDDGFLPKSERRWTKKRYEDKILKLGQVISQIGDPSYETPPAIIGLAEVENKAVLHDLTQSKYLRHHNYGFVHYDSQDERGIDVALLYHRDVFELMHAETFSVYLEKEPGVQYFTRDILLVSGELHSEKIHLIVNHWPSRFEGLETSAIKRMAVAKKVLKIIEQLQFDDPKAKILVMGDFNDDPDNDSMKHLVDEAGLVNAMETLRSYSRGSHKHRFKWHLFDQILLTSNFFESRSNQLKYDKADIYDPQYLKTYEGRFKGQPFGTFVGTKYKGGFSDHFPVYLCLKRVSV